MADPEAVGDRLVLTGRIVSASNAVLVGELDGEAVVYKPVVGERPLHDFPDGTLARREVAAYAVSRASGWDVVPPTRLVDGPYGVGMLQRWIDADLDQDAVTLVPADAVPSGMLHVLDGVGADDEPVSLVHEDTPVLRRIAVLDVLLNNADRKGGHVLEVAGGHRHGIDHGLTMHVDPKLRTVLWGWIGDPLADEELAGVRRVLDALDAELGEELGALLRPDEVAALADRCEALLQARAFPEPHPGLPAVPWPPF
ncbi:SCO1664 family protein [Agrococcus sp. SGAir0287]|uniref:SCO1664 family protein n=1 Tax=Agrococcus sp. SGAir0287 TaxID=2070347 RepID=UPI0010CCC422|nr:SCO1664 family protein [Agrococcus sp. SGAir0287]QCR20794.1 SCO1664 family protein [Agrococcus sp. SGAir0287]